MRRMLRFVCAVIVALGFSALLLADAQAAAPPTKILTITPSTEKPNINPGATTKGSFQIINQGQQTYPVHVYSAPYSVQGEAYTPDFMPLPGRPKVAEWLHFTTDASTITPGQTLTVGYAIDVPTGTQPGGYYVVAFVETKAGTSGKGVVINERVGEIFYITVAGPVKQAGSVVSWSSSFLQASPLNATLRLENDGGVHYASNIDLHVRDVFGHSKYSLTTQKEVLPQTIRKVTANWSNAPPFGLFKVSGSATAPGATQALPTKYVLVVSPTAWIVLATIVAIVLAFTVGKSAARKRLKRKRISTD